MRVGLHSSKRSSAGIACVIAKPEWSVQYRLHGNDLLLINDIYAIWVLNTSRFRKGIFSMEGEIAQGAHRSLNALK